MTTGDDVRPKDLWRRVLLATRAARASADLTADRRRVTDHVLALVDAVRSAGAARRGSDPDMTVCVYLPLPTEPLAPDLPIVLAGVGVRTLAPVVRPGKPLDWSEVTDGAGRLSRGALGISEPTGKRLGPEAIRGTDIILVPALAVDVRGHRLGRGGGFYDRSLSLLTPEGPEGSASTPLTVAVVFDDEVLREVPHRVHDIPVGAFLCPRAGVCHVAKTAFRGASSS